MTLEGESDSPVEVQNFVSYWKIKHVALLGSVAALSDIPAVWQIGFTWCILGEIFSKNHSMRWCTDYG